MLGRASIELGESTQPGSSALSGLVWLSIARTDVGALAKQRASDEANKALDEQKQKAQDKLKDKLKGLLNR